MKKRNCVSGLIMFCCVATASAAGEDPLDQFELIVAACKAQMATTERVEVAYVEAAKTWVKRAVLPPAVAFDVRKTDSLVSPLIGILQIRQGVSSQRAGDEMAANALEPATFTRPFMRSWRFEYSWRSNAWHLTSASWQSDYVTGSPTKGRYGDTEIQELSAPLRACAGHK